MRFFCLCLSGLALVSAQGRESDYAIGKYLGEGGFADVFQAIQTPTGRVVAVKVPKIIELDNPIWNQTAEIANEQRMMEMMRGSKYSIELLDSYINSTSELTNFVMPFARYGSLVSYDGTTLSIYLLTLRQRRFQRRDFST